jgi:alpha-acetolactate decarboxylase
MLLLDGFFYRIDGAGKVRLAGMDEKTPFAAVTSFEADRTVLADSAFFHANLSSDRTADVRKVEK